MLCVRPSGHTLVKTVCSILRNLDIDVPVEGVVPGPPPWQFPVPEVCYIPNSKAYLPTLQRQLAVAAIASTPVTHPMYTDGSLQTDGRAGCAVYSPFTGELAGSSASCFIQFHFLWTLRYSGRSQSPLSTGYWWCDHMWLSVRPTGSLCCESCMPLRRATHPLSFGPCSRTGNGITIPVDSISCWHFLQWQGWRTGEGRLWYSSHDAGLSPSLSCFLTMVRAASFLITSHHRDRQRTHSIFIQHYDAFRHHCYKYRRRVMMVRRHNVVAARLRLGYRQVAGLEDAPHFFSCLLCQAPNSYILDHYCLHCPIVAGMVPRGQPLVTICRHLLANDNLVEILARHPRFGWLLVTLPRWAAFHAILCHVQGNIFFTLFTLCSFCCLCCCWCNITCIYHMSLIDALGAINSSKQKEYFLHCL